MSDIHSTVVKDATTNTRAVVKSDGTNNALVVTQNAQPLPSGASTTDKQDSQITLATALNALATQLAQQQITTDDVYKVLQDIRDGIMMPPDFAEASNARQVSVVAGTLPAVTTVTTVTTVTGVTNIGGFSADMLTENASMSAWAQLRNLYE